MRPVLDGGPQLAGDALYDQIAHGQGNPAPIEPTFELVRFLLSPASAHVSGRFLSARWDDPATLDAAAVAGSRRTLRRIDGRAVHRGRAGRAVTVGVAIVGCGLVGAKRAAALPEEFELVAVFDPDVARADAVARSASIADDAPRCTSRSQRGVGPSNTTT